MDTIVRKQHGNSFAIYVGGATCHIISRMKM
ncbi:hypothetical protein OIU77_007011 [Salix suchowensis]|uniref:Uncharacterized protein n=1 Tax=Salix suchowensis TaxID=1278906 RepID=A0ABQ9AMV2_9ROSI|nr:hypothetical protein OIU77_007011 [Salix suchowensis]